MERAGLVACLLASLAAAHPLDQPKRDRLTLTPATVRLTIDYSVSDEDARALREILQRPITDYLVQQATYFVRLTVDGEAVALKIDRVAAMPAGVHVELSATVSRPHRVKLQDRHKDRRITVPVTVALEGLELSRPLPPQPFVFSEHPLELDLK